MKIALRILAILICVLAGTSAYANDANFLTSIVNLSPDDIQIRIVGGPCVSWADGTNIDPVVLKRNAFFLLGFYRNGNCHGNDGRFSVQAMPTVPSTAPGSYEVQWLNFSADGGLVNSEGNGSFGYQLLGAGRVIGDTEVYEMQILTTPKIVPPPPPRLPDANYILSVVNFTADDVQVQVLTDDHVSSCISWSDQKGAGVPVTLKPNDALPVGFYRSGLCHGRNGYIGIRAAGAGLPWHALSDDDFQTLTFDADGGLEEASPSSAYRSTTIGYGRVIGDTATYELRILPTPSQAAAPTPRLSVIQAFAPLIYLHWDETFMPASIEYFAANMRMECDGVPLAKDILALTSADMPPGRGMATPGTATARCRMSSRSAMNGPYDMKPFFNGVTPTTANPVPVYVFTYDATSELSFTAQYNAFYPWNKGKMACPIFAPDDQCFGSRVELDDHVGDWELMTIRFENGHPVSVHVGAHGNIEPGQASTYTLASGWAGLQWLNDHPVVYAAAGSHGTWATAGDHTYEVLLTGDKLTDHTRAGAAWETWHDVVLATDPRYAFLLGRYEGDWGNFHQGKDPCDLSLGNNDLCRAAGIPVGENYQLNDGPTIPDRARDRAFVGGPSPHP